MYATLQDSPKWFREQARCKEKENVHWRSCGLGASGSRETGAAPPNAHLSLTPADIIFTLFGFVWWGEWFECIGERCDFRLPISPLAFYIKYTHSVVIFENSFTSVPGTLFFSFPDMFLTIAFSSLSLDSLIGGWWRIHLHFFVIFLLNSFFFSFFSGT